MPATGFNPVTATPSWNAPLRVYAGYRVALALILLVMFSATPTAQVVGTLAPALYLGVGSAYLLFAVIAATPIPRRQPLAQPGVFTLFFLDLVALSLMTHASGGIGSGIGLLMLITVAASGIVVPGRLALLTAALATLAILAGTVHLISIGQLDSTALLPAGLLGLLCFATALFVMTLTRRMSSTQQLAQDRAADVTRLLQLNRLIVQRMRTGVLVVGPDRRIRTLNQSAAELLGLRLDPEDEEHGLAPPLPLPAPLENVLEQWQRDPAHTPPAFTARPDGPELLARCTRFDEAGDILLFLEDQGQLAQHAQQLKLAALGRLTASIAHEIRNPLGAISHAAQLLGESATLETPDRRLAEIIQNHSQRIDRIIGNVLQLSRRRAPDPRRLPLARWLQDFVDDFLEDDPEAQVELTLQHEAEVTFDGDQLRQVLVNLLENALRYSARATGERRGLLRLERDPVTGLARLDVVDSGPGVPEDEREKIFEPFYTTEAQGNGLGLFLSRELCEINQARLSHLRDADGRSCFRISFAHPDRRPLREE